MRFGVDDGRWYSYGCQFNDSSYDMTDGQLRYCVTDSSDDGAVMSCGSRYGDDDDDGLGYMTT